jgi:hypothetical protein
MPALRLCRSNIRVQAQRFRQVLALNSAGRRGVRLCGLVHRKSGSSILMRFYRCFHRCCSCGGRSNDECRYLLSAASALKGRSKSPLGWNRRFDEPIPLRGGRQLVTLKAAAARKLIPAIPWAHDQSRRSVLFRPDDRTPGLGHRACRPVPKVHKPDG